VKQSEREYSRTTKVVYSKRRKNKCKDNFRQYTTFKMPQFFDLCSSLDSAEEYTLNVCLKSFLHKFFLLLPYKKLAAAPLPAIEQSPGPPLRQSE
jgi:hypothetical protein